MTSLRRISSHNRPGHRACLIIWFALLVGGACYADTPIAVLLPQASVDTDFETQAGRLIPVAAGEDLQAALELANPGDVIELEAGAVYAGPFVLPDKPGAAWITIRGAGDPIAPGVRVTPSASGSLPVLLSGSVAAITAAPGAHHYRFIGVEIRPAPGGLFHARTLVDLSASRRDPLNIPHHIVFERSYLHGDPVRGTRRGIAMNGAHMAVTDSHLSDFKVAGQDAQAIAGWDGPGPYRIVNNFLEAAGENLLFGGADPMVNNRVPADIEIRGNYFSKSLTWKQSSEADAGPDWTIKNLLELKNASRVLIDGNLFEFNWPHAQNGFAILFTVRNQDGKAPWSVVEDVTFSNNIVRHVASGINILGSDDIYPSRQTARILIRNNLFYDVGGAWGDGRLLQLLEGIDGLVVENNTALQSEHILMSEGAIHTRFTFRNNIVMHNRYGVTGNGTGSGNDTLQAFFAEPVFEGNVLIGAPGGIYPRNNRRPVTVKGAGFVDAGAHDYRLKDAGRSNTATAGVDHVALCEALSATERPGYCQEMARPAQ